MLSTKIELFPLPHLSFSNTTFSSSTHTFLHLQLGLANSFLFFVWGIPQSNPYDIMGPSLPPSFPYIWTFLFIYSYGYFQRGYFLLCLVVDKFEGKYNRKEMERKIKNNNNNNKFKVNKLFLYNILNSFK